MKLDTMTKVERALLLYLEACAVDQRGAVDAQRINEFEADIVARWREAGFIQFGRIASQPFEAAGVRENWVELSQEAWALAHAERQAQSARMSAKRAWLKAEEL